MQPRYLTRRLRSITVFSASVAVIFLSTFLLNRMGLLYPANPRNSIARSFIIWLHGLGDSGPANEPIRTFFSSAEFKNTKWSFPSAPLSPVSCSNGAVMPSWFDIYKIPLGDTLMAQPMWNNNSLRNYWNTNPKKIKSTSCASAIWTCLLRKVYNSLMVTPKDERGLLKAVKNIHSMIDKEVAAGTSPENIFVCGFSQGGALTLASALLYPKTLGGGAVFSGWVPFNNTIKEKVSPEARKTPILWLHGMADPTVLFEAGQAGPPFMEDIGVQCEFKAFPTLGHSIRSEELNTLALWIKARLGDS